MKKRVFAATAVLMLSVASFAWEFPGFEWSVGADITSAYLWRGMNYGGLAFQPDVQIGYGGLNLEAWANLSPKDYAFKEFAPELDITLSYSIVGLKVGVNHQYYFDGTKYFDYSTPAAVLNAEGEWEVDEDRASNQTEVFAEFNLGDVLEDVPLHLGWYTYIGGDDWYIDDENKVKRAYSSYFDVSYEFDLPLGFSLTPTVGMTPWKSCYNYYDKNFSVNNVSLKLNWEFEAGDHFALDLYAIGMVNTSGINKDNFWTNFKQTYSEGLSSPRLNFALGLGLWLF